MLVLIFILYSPCCSGSVLVSLDYTWCCYRYSLQLGQPGPALMFVLIFIALSLSKVFDLF